MKHLRECWAHGQHFKVSSIPINLQSPLAFRWEEVSICPVWGHLWRGVSVRVILREVRNTTPVSWKWTAAKSASILCGLVRGGCLQAWMWGLFLGSEFCSLILPAHRWWESLRAVHLPRLGGRLWSQPVQTSSEGPFAESIGSTGLSTESFPTAQLPLA